MYIMLTQHRTTYTVNTGVLTVRTTTTLVVYKDPILA